MERVSMSLGMALLSLSIGMVACGGDDKCSAEGRVLIVQAAGLQPASAALGTIVVAQSRRATAIGIRTRGCLHVTAGSSTPGEVSCLPIPDDLTRTYFTALTDGDACIVHAELYDSNCGASPEGTAGLVCTGNGVKVAETEVPIVATSDASPAPADGPPDAGDDGSGDDASGGQ